MIPRNEIYLMNDKDPITWKFFFLIYLAQFIGYIKIVQITIPEDESEEGQTEKTHQYEMINGKLIPMFGESCNKNPICRALLRVYTGVQWAYYNLEFLMKKFKPQGEL